MDDRDVLRMVAEAQLLREEVTKLRPLAEIGKLAVAEAQMLEVWMRCEGESATPDLMDAQRARAKAVAAYRDTQARDGTPKERP